MYRNRLHIDRHDDMPEADLDFRIGWVSMDGGIHVVLGIIRDQSLGQTYLILRHEGDTCVVRRWVPPYSPLVNSIPWELINTQYTVPVDVLASVPLDRRLPEHNMLVRRYDGSDVRVFAFDSVLHQWRHVPDEATFQALGFYWCDVTAAGDGYFARYPIGPPFLTIAMQVRDDYPACRT